MRSSVFVVARSEFLRRVRSRMFLVGTLLVPLLLFGFGGISGALVAMASQTETQRVAVVDPSGSLAPLLRSDARARFHAVPDEAAARAALAAGRADAYLLVPDDPSEAVPVRYVEAGRAGLLVEDLVRGRVADAVRGIRLTRAGVSAEAQRALDAPVPFQASTAAPEADRGSALGGAALGFALGLVLYAVVLIYGQTVMMGVLEEKQHRVLEVLASSVRPFDLLLGKVLGIGAVGLVQMGLWMLLAAVAVGGAAAALSSASLPPEAADALRGAMPRLTPGLGLAFLGFFLGGYLLYASLFAAVGAAVEQQQDAQPLLLPLMAPVVLSFVALQAVLANPDGPAGVAMSLVPFFAPVVMPARMAATAVPAWQVLASLTGVVAVALGAVWLSARIYRIGILSYGKKPTLRDLARWVRTP